MNAYKLLKEGPAAPKHFNQIWKNAAVPRYKVFFWLLLKDRLNRRELLQRKTMHLPCYNCVLCNSNFIETSLHLFWDCPFSLACWDSVCPNKNRRTSVLEECDIVIQVLQKKIALNIVIMGSWNI